MKKKMVLWLCVLVLLTTFTGCSKNNNKKEQKNLVTEMDSGKETSVVSVASSDQMIIADHYMEQEIQDPKLGAEEYRIGSRINNDNQYELYTTQDSVDKTYCMVYCYTLKGNIFYKSTVKWATKASRELSLTPESLCQSEDGNDYMQFIKVTAHDDGHYASRVILKKTEDEKGYFDVTPSYWSETTSKIQYCDGPFISSLKITKNQTMCYQEDGEGELVFYDMKANKLMDHGSITNSWQYALKENTIYTFTDDLNKVLIYNLENDQKETIDFVRGNSGIYQRLIQVGPKNEITILDNSGLHICEDGETEWKTVVDGVKCSMSTPTLTAESLTILPGSFMTYLVIYRSTEDSNKGYYAKYEPAKEEKEEDDQAKKLTICSLFDNPTIRMVISNYREQHPDVEITYNLLWDMESTDVAATRAEIIRSLNVELLAGNGADILLLDYLPIDSFIEKGVLMDISDIFHAEGKKNILLDSILNAYDRDGKTYCMATKFLLPYFGMHEDISQHTRTVEDIAEYCKDKDTKFLATATYKRLLEEFIQLYPNEIFAEDGSIKKDGLTSFSSSMNVIAAQIQAIHGPTEDQYSTGNEDDYYQTLPDSLMNEKSTIAVKSYMGSLSELERTVAILREMKGTYVPVNNTFIPFGIVGINNATKAPDLAKEFVTSMFDESIQSLDLNDGFPVNRESLMNLNSPCRQIDCISYQTSTGEYKTIIIDSLTDDDMKEFQDYVNSLTTIAYMDEDCRDILAQAGAEYLEGKITLEQAVNDIIQKYNIYFAE